MLGGETRKISVEPKLVAGGTGWAGWTPTGVRWVHAHHPQSLNAVGRPNVKKKVQA